jgi:hypothetical protein
VQLAQLLGFLFSSSARRFDWQNFFDFFSLLLLKTKEENFFRFDLFSPLVAVIMIFCRVICLETTNFSHFRFALQSCQKH